MIKSYQDGPVHFVLFTKCYVIKAIVHDVDIYIYIYIWCIYQTNVWQASILNLASTVNKWPICMLDHNYTTQLMESLRPFSIVYIVSRQLMFEWFLKPYHTIGFLSDMSPSPLLVALTISSASCFTAMPTTI